MGNSQEPLRFVPRLRVRIRSVLPALSILMIAGILVAVPAGRTGATAETSRYVAVVVNDQYPTSNSITEVTGTGSSWLAGRPLVLGSGNFGLSSIAFTPNGKTAYVDEGASNKIAPIDPSTFRPGKSFSAGVIAPFYDAVTPNGRLLLTVGLKSDSIAAINTASQKVQFTVKVGLEPTSLVILPNNRFAYVENSLSNTVSVVTLTGKPKVVKTISFPGGGCSDPSYAAVTPDGESVYVTCAASYELWRINVLTNIAMPSGINIPKGAGPANGGVHQVVITPNGRTAYVANGNDIYPISLVKSKVGKGISMTHAWSLSLSHDGVYLMTGQSDNGCGCSTDNVEVIRVATGVVLQRFGTGGYEHFSVVFEP